MEIKINPGKVPIYVQIEEQMRAMIAAGQLRPGDQLPTIRHLAADLRVNYNTVARAYLDLDRDGIITTQRGRGTFVTGVPDEAEMNRLRVDKLHSVVRSVLKEAHHLGYTQEEIAAAFQHELARWTTSDET